MMRATGVGVSALAATTTRGGALSVILGAVFPLLGGCAPVPDEVEEDLELGVLEQPLRAPGNGFGLDEQLCLGADGADSAEGRVHNRFLWCQRWTLVRRQRSRGAVVGRAELDFEALAYGRDDGTRDVHVLFRGVGARYLLPGTITPATDLTLGVDCDDAQVLPGTPGCQVDGDDISASFEFWETNREWLRWVVRSDDAGLLSFDKVARHSFSLTARGGSSDDKGPPVAIRCDSAQYFRGRPKACILDDTLPHLQYSIADDRVRAVAEHIQQAFDRPATTYPSATGEKSIPGKYTGDRSSPALRRVDYKGPLWQKNQLEKDRACNRRDPYQATGLPAALYPTGSDCDEYPFASTSEGAGSSQWDFSVLGVNRSQNRCAGNALKRYYGGDRILYYNDPFWVEITDVPQPSDESFCSLPLDDEPSDDDEEGLPIFPAPIRDFDDPPEVDAGLDVSGGEGNELVLNGNARDTEGSVAVRWSYRALAGVDAGAACTFTNSRSTTTRFSCTDDGTFEVTLTADDGVNAPVSDSAIVTLENLPPVLYLNGPEPWQLFTVGSQVNLDLRVEDAANDTHGCEVDWDDGQVEEHAAGEDGCGRAHVFEHPGMFTLRAKVADDDGASASAEVLVVVHDPAGRSATADGSVASPAGASSATPAFAGEAWFHLTARYYPFSDGVPVGDAQSWLPGTDFRLISAGNTLEWLVVTPENEIAAKGRGRLAGVPGDYGFVFYGHAGCEPGGLPCAATPERLRMVVWNLADGAIPGGDIVYDNVRNASFDLDEAEPRTLASGSVTLHFPP